MDLGAFFALVVTGLQLLAYAVAAMAAVRARRHQKSERLRPFVDRLEGGTLRATWGAMEVRGGFQGRDLRLTLARGGLTYQLRVPGRSDAFRIDLGDALARADGDAPTAGLGPGAQRTEVLWALRHLRVTGFHSLELRQGWLTIERHAFEYALRPASLEHAFEALAQLVPLFARTALAVKVGPAQGAGEAGPTWAWAAEAHAIRCPYCRDALAPDRDELAACPGCRTVHHAECLSEAGGCTVFGCGARGEPARAEA